MWQAVGHVFAGIRPTPDGLAIEPHLPSSWQQVRVGLRYRGHRVQVHAGHDEIAVITDAPLRVTLPGAGSRQLPVGGGRWRRTNDWWEVLA